MDGTKHNLDDGECRIWWAEQSDQPWVLHLLKAFRAFDFFWAPDAVVAREIARGNILCFDYRRLEAGYVWVTQPPNGRARINQLAVDEELWRNKVGTKVVAFLELHLRKRCFWSVYLSCNTNTMGHSFWPAVGYSAIIEKPGGVWRKGANIIWAKLLEDGHFLFPPSIAEVKTYDSYRFQSSITAATVRRRAQAQM
jgi:GNAT superfamily N-acetyltransferase